MMHKFFETLFGDKSPNDYILIWLRYNGSSAWFTDIEAAIDYTEKNKNYDIYVGCGTSPSNFGPKKRCITEQISGIPGLWLDLDVKNPAHKKQRLPETEEDVQKILSCFPMAPTLDIMSGHGRQFWWAFKEFWNFESTEERLKAASLMHRFNIMFRNEAMRLGFEMDMVYDLARIMRVPGTMNVKNASQPVLCTILSHNDIGYIPDDLDMIIPEAPPPPILSPSQTLAASKGGHFTLDPVVEPPWAKISVLLTNSPEFQLSWQAKRTFASGKDSGSEYDLSLATYALQAGWSWQETVDMMIAFRRMNNFKPKSKNENDPKSPLREDYYLRTIQKASNWIIQEQARANVEDIANKIGEVTELPLDQRVQVVRANLTDLLGVQITRIVRVLQSPPDHIIETPQGNIHIGEAKNLIDQKRVRDGLAEIKHHLHPISKERWFNVAAALLNACEDEYASEDATDAGQVKRWLTKYLSQREPNYTFDDSVKSEEPFCEGDNFYLHCTHFCEWLGTFEKERISTRAMRFKLREFGFTATKFNIIKHDGKKGKSATSKSLDYISIHDPTISQFVNLESLRIANEARTEKRQK